MMILVTGGAGYIGSHTVLELLDVGFSVVVFDSLINSSRESLARVEGLTGKSIQFIHGDIRDEAQLDAVFSQFNIDGVLHFAGLKEIAESLQRPLYYYENNVYGTQVLLRVMDKHNVKRLIFSSSATVYGDPERIPIRETNRTGGTTNPYGTSKYMIERILADLCAADSNWRISVLRYFNPIGAHSSGKIGEHPTKTPANLLPYVSQVAIGRLQELQVFGNDYPTHDGTGVRDYIHVVDLALGHIAALHYLDNHAGYHVFNLGTGQGYSVFDIINAFEKVANKRIPYRIVSRRSGDIASCFADPNYAETILGWRATRGLETMIEDAWRWQRDNPKGYA